MKVFGTDYDGVVINIEPQKAEAFGALLHEKWNVNKEEAAKFWIGTGGKSRRSKFDHFYEKQFGKKLQDEDYKVIESRYGNILKTEFYPKLKLLPGASDLLQYARSHFDYTFVSSGVPMLEIEYLVDLNGLTKYFDKILGTNEKYPSKREHFQEILSTQKPDNLIFIADGTEDMKVAKEFGAITIGIPTNHSEGELSNAGARYTCDLSQAVPIIQKLL